MEYELDKEKFFGRGRLELPVMVENSKPFSNSPDLSLDLICAMKQTVKIKPGKKVSLSLIISISDIKEEAVQNLKTLYSLLVHLYLETR